MTTFEKIIGMRSAMTGMVMRTAWWIGLSLFCYYVSGRLSIVYYTREIIEDASTEI